MDIHGDLRRVIYKGRDVTAERPVLPGDRLAAIAESLGIPECGGCRQMREELNAGTGFFRAAKNRILRALRSSYS